jgi:AbrB family looped-hinge helix DNA binding protein
LCAGVCPWCVRRGLTGSVRCRVILHGMTTRVGPKGQVVLPKAVRDKLGIRPGDQVVVEEVGGEARVRRVENEARLRGLLKYGDPLGELEAEHRRELEGDAARNRRRAG